MTFVTWIWTWKMRALAHNVWAPRLSPLPRALVGLRARYADMSVCVACSLINTQTVGGCPRRRPVAASPPLAECGGSRGSSGPLSSSRVSWIMGPPWPWRNATSDGPGPGPGPGLHLSKKVGARARVFAGSDKWTLELERNELTGASRESGLSTVACPEHCLLALHGAQHGQGGRGCSTWWCVLVDARLARITPAQGFRRPSGNFIWLLQPFFDVDIGGLGVCYEHADMAWVVGDLCHALLLAAWACSSESRHCPSPRSPVL